MTALDASDLKLPGTASEARYYHCEMIGLAISIGYESNSKIHRLTFTSNEGDALGNQRGGISKNVSHRIPHRLLLLSYKRTLLLLSILHAQLFTNTVHNS